MDVHTTRLPDIPLVQLPELDGILRGFLEEAVHKLVQVSGDHAPKAVFLSGSARWGEFMAVPGPGGLWHPLSDLDLFLVVERRTAALLGRIQDEMETWFRDRFRGTFTHSPLTVGTYAQSDLPSQHPTLGVAELRRARCCLWGDPRLLQRFPDPEAEGIEPWEAVRLLLNRSLEFVEAWGRTVTRPEDELASLDREYALAKLGADLATAFLASLQTVVWGYEERSLVISRMRDEKGEPLDMDGRLQRLIGRRSNPPSPNRERMADWRVLGPLDDVLPVLRWTWGALVDSRDAASPGILRRERGGGRYRYWMLRGALGQRPEGYGALETARLWWATRPAKSFRTALGWGCLKFLMLLESAKSRGSGAAARLSPWISPGSGEDPHGIAAGLSHWVAWVRRVEAS